MAKFVIKRNGTKEPFDVEKIRKAIAAAAKRTDLSAERVNEITEKALEAVNQIAEGKEEIATSELGAKILSELDSLEPSVSNTWREHDREKGKV